MIEEIDKWRKAGEITSKAIEYGMTLVKQGANVREVCDLIDQKIIELGAKPAWPTQIGLNHVAAHYTPDAEDNSVFTDELVCLDVGAHIEGFVGDTACTIDLSGKYSDLIKAAKEALEAAKKVVQIGTPLGEIGKTIQEVITSYGFSPIKNLSGHGINRWIIHDSPSIPNFNTKEKEILKQGQIIAIEPFATTGAGFVEEIERSNIFSLANKKPVRSPFAREILSFVEWEYETLPFTTRWLSKKFGVGKTSLAIKELLANGSLHSHPPLVEKNKGMVSVWENTLLIDEKVEVLTKF